MNRNEFERLVDQGIAGDITEAKIYKIIDYESNKQWSEGEYIYLENIALSCFELIYSQIIDDGRPGYGRSEWLLIKQILSGEKSWFFSRTLRMPSGNGFIPQKARWLLDLIHDSEWTTLRELIMQYRETHFISPDIQEKYWEKLSDDEFKGKTIIDLMKNIIYHNISLTWFDKDAKGVEHFKPDISYGEEANPLDFTNKLLRIIDFCEGKTFLIVGVNYLNGQPMISLLS